MAQTINKIVCENNSFNIPIPTVILILLFHIITLPLEPRIDFICSAELTD